MDKLDAQALVSLCPDPVIGVDAKGIVRIFNAAAEKLIGYQADEVIGKINIIEIYPDRESAKYVKQMMQSDQFGELGSVEGLETTLLTATNLKVPVRLSASLYKEGNGSIGFFHDLTDRRNLEKQLHKLSVTDELTGLFNQRHFYNVLAKELDRAKRYSHTLSLICFDLDNFKQVNDTLGHLEGDRILKIIGEILSDTLRLSDIPVRYGGDEFMVLLPETEIKAAAKTAERIRVMFNNKCPHSVDSETSIAKVSVSLGVTETSGVEKPDQIVQRADLAMYESKSSGGNKTVLIKQHIGDVVDNND